jgi:hypothetical protein
MLRIESGKPVHFVEIETGKNLTGTLIISDDSIHAKIYSYTDFFYIKGEQPVILQAETNDIVSLHSNITTPPGKTVLNIEPQRITYCQEIISNIAVVGHDPWTAEDKIKRVTFNVKHTTDLMHHSIKVKALGRSKHPKTDDLTIFTDTADGMTLKARYNASYEMLFNAPKEFWPVFEIEFDKPRRLTDYIASVMDYVGFISFCLGVRLKPSGIHFDRLSTPDMNSAIESGNYPGTREARYAWPEPEINLRDLWIGGSPLCTRDNKELNSFRTCLISWMNRAPEWKKPYKLMMATFRLKKAFSAERLINACRWFENIPIAQTQNALTEEHIKIISDAVSKKAQELGHPAITCNRIAGAIKRVKTETNEEQFTRLISILETKFGEGILGDGAVAHLKQAIQFRGRAAHGHFEPKSTAEFYAFATATHAMEALCYLLTALDLPIPKKGIERIKSNPLVQNYRVANS